MKEILNGKDLKEIMIVASVWSKTFLFNCSFSYSQKNKLEEVLESVKLYLTQVISENK